MHFQISSGKENRYIRVIKIRVLRSFLANNFVLSDAEDNASGSLNRGSISDLTLLRTVLAICQNSQEPSFWEVMDSFL